MKKALLILCLFTSYVFASEDVNDINSIDAGNDGWIQSLYKDVWTLPETIYDQSIDISTNTDNLTWFLLASGGSIALRQGGGDKRIAEDIENNRFFRDKWSDEGLAIVGGPGFHFAAAGLWYAIADHTGSELNKDRAWTMIEALAVTGTATLALKAAINDETPNGKRWAWPSGHTSSSMTVAAVLDEFYGPSVGIPAYIGAGVVGWRMMDSGDHWASDVLFGAVLGYIVGHKVAGDGKDMTIAGFEINPYISQSGSNVAGVSFVKYW